MTVIAMTREMGSLGKDVAMGVSVEMGVAYKAIQNGFMARFTTAAALINELRVAHDLNTALKPYLQPHVLVIDEMGYLGYGPGAADVLFQVVDQRYLKGKPILFTTNKPLKHWGRVLHDEELARAIIDRTLHYGELLDDSDIGGW